VVRETIKCVREVNSLLVPVKIGDRTSLMLFDTGARNITISEAMAAALSISPKDILVDETLEGVGTTQICATKYFANVEVGSFSREKFPINVLAHSSMPPVIGSNFFEKYSITVDVCHSEIVLSNEREIGERIAASVEKPGERAKASGRVDIIPRVGLLLVPVTVNGHLTRMLLDSGADGITFSKEQAKAAELVVPTVTSLELHMGIGGTVRGVGFTVGELAVGPFVKKNVKVSVIESPGMPYPLLGAEFLKDCTYTISKDRSQITFGQFNSHAQAFTCNCRPE
jgi:clan AA aspartic protease (TIGR02281 family)